MAQMVARGEGNILVTGSISGQIAASFNGVYNATEAFVANFTDALREELKAHRGVFLTTLKPAATDTMFLHPADGWEAMLKGQGNIASGLTNKVLAASAGSL